MAINLMAPKGNDQNVKLSTEIWKKLNEVKTTKAQGAIQATGKQDGAKVGKDAK